MRQKMKFGGGIFAPPQGYYPQNHTDIGFGMSGPQGLVIPSFWVPFADLGSGVVDTTEIMTNATPTFTRATTAWTRLSTGLWASVASGSPRSYYNASLVYCGYLAETARTNRCLQARDLTNGSWVKTGGGGTTAAKTQTGIDGAANSCSLLTASGVDGTCLQAITNASAARSFSCWMKRSVGTGTISITLDNGSTYTDITSQINSSTFTLVQAQQTLANPTVGFKISSSGDAVIIDMCQEETGAGASTPIPTTVAAVARNLDLLTYATGTFFNATEGTLYAEPTHIHSISGSCVAFGIDDGTVSNRMALFTALATQYSFFLNNGGVTQCNVAATKTFSLDSPVKAAAVYKANDFTIACGGVAGGTDTSGSLPTVTTMEIANGFGGSQLNGAVRNVKYFNRRISNSQLVALTA